MRVGLLTGTGTYGVDLRRRIAESSEAVLAVVERALTHLDAGCFTSAGMVYRFTR